MRAHLALEHPLEAEVVGDAGEVGGVGEGDGRQRGAFRAVVARQLRGDVHRLAERTAVAAGIDPVARLEAPHQQPGCLRDALLSGAVGAKALDDFFPRVVCQRHLSPGFAHAAQAFGIGQQRAQFGFEVCRAAAFHQVACLAGRDH